MVAAFPSSLLCGINVVSSVYILSAKMNLLSMFPSLGILLNARDVLEDLLYILSENQKIASVTLNTLSYLVLWFNF